MKNKDKQKKVKTPKRVKVKYFKSTRKGMAECHLCHKKLHGVSRQTPIAMSKASKSMKRPTALFAGVLCNECRLKAWQEAIKVKLGIKKISDEGILLRPYIDNLLKRL